MAERGEESSDGFSSSSVDSCEDFGSPSPSSSSGESANEVEPDTSSISRPSSSKRKKNDSPPRSTGKATEKQQQKKNKKGKLSLTNDEIEELSSWIFSAQEAAQVEAEIRPQVAGSPRVKVFSERERFTKHLLSEEQKANFQLLIAGFCRKFAILVSDCYKLPDKKNRKSLPRSG